MKVLKDGRLGKLKKWATQVTCPANESESARGCGAELKISVKDLRLACDPGPCGRRYYPAVVCPECGTLVEVTGVPRLIWAGLCTDEALIDPLMESDF